MAFQIVLNMLIAVVWMFLVNDWTVSGLTVGYLIGLSFIFVLRRFFPQKFYLHRVWAAIKLLFLFLRELIMSNVAVIGQILSPKLHMRPGIFALAIDLRSDWEITLLANLLNLTPGTLTLEISPNRRTLYVHAMDINNVDTVVHQIKWKFEKAIMEVTR
ncbi:Na+/H+ antiporter subunit E [Paenibacillus senegalensis]|uniref:Na+/H+ antiporter subunit E n=1 Tax=Paenibacillus senegalensis TaxID=1465766 RepID=UPI000288AC2D|nr:Na+/H+ antiporter subunit E [Paenibacillus senegalensis]